ncbi:glycosyltransferase family 4 protein [Phenylobacterium sp. J367]|uniref:glycosyltransferase family 4 protein n=1 Tax=Phenylobacterium sp. J367 TaxID=2898435 RepID=UPI002151A770|nr:glycosyltransferase family 4 protein [Phenylobacterium sp. J367]MCR5879507.1 glycosyltransferase family 4 protein [Phenylobacterium sp. J367]
MTSHPRLRVLVDTPKYFVRPNNTDWSYMRSLGLMETFIPVDFLYPSDPLDIVDSAFLIGGRICPPLARRLYTPHIRTLNLRRVVNMRPDIVLSHRRFPVNCRNIPVIWHHAVLDPEMQLFAHPQCDIARKYDEQSEMYHLATGVQVSTVSEASRHAERYPDIGERFHPVPFFLPHLTPVELDSLHRKHFDDQLLRVLFVGRDAKRKGLDLLLHAVALLPPDARRRLHITIVTSFGDGEIPLPAGTSIEHYAALPPADVVALMHRCHIFAMPSRFESFGFTYVEAMASGCAVVGPAWEVQRELLGNGAGLTVRPDPGMIADALLTLIASRQRRIDLALGALRRYKERYSPSVVADAHLRMFERVVRDWQDKQ